MHFSELAKLQNSTLTKTDGGVVRLKKKRLPHDHGISNAAIVVAKSFYE